MQPCILLHSLHLYQFNESGKRALGVHHLEDYIVFAVATVV